MVNSKHAFWQALIFALIIFVMGFAFGFFLEGGRTEKAQIDLIYSEVNILDEQLRDRIIEDLELDCDSAIQSTFEFADKIYNEARKLEKYDASTKFTDTLKILHRRYDLLRLMLWSESTKLREKCGSDFHTVIYFFKYDTDDINEKSKQVFFSKLLLDVKEKHANKILLIPIAANLELSSIELTTKSFKINNLPAIVIDEKIVVDDIITLEELEKIIFKEDKKEKIVLN